MNRFKDKVVLVTGGNRNTGCWLVKKFLEEGARVFTCARNQKSYDEGVKNLARLGAVTLALGVSTPGYCIHETLFDDVPWRKDVIDEDVKFVDGMMYPSDRPGLGIELNEDAVLAHPKADHWLRHYVGTLTNVRPPDSVKYFHA